MHRYALIPVITVLSMLAPRAVGVQAAATQGVATRSSPDAERAAAKGTIVYRLSFPEPEHRWMQVEVTFADVPAGPLHARMSRSSPGRYALHEFAKNVYDVHAFDGRGREVAVVRANPHQWDVPAHDGTVRLTYKIFGDLIDGTYMAVDTTHAHLNMPAALMWARGLHDRAATVRFEQPARGDNLPWRVATQLFPTGDPLVFTAPNLQYLMDSPAEFGAFSLREFKVESGGRTQTIRLAVHHDATDMEVDALAGDVEKIVLEQVAVFGELPQFDNGTYTFLMDYLPWAGGDGMEHRNSTVCSASTSLKSGRGVTGTASHEFFHAWNVERIRPRSLEPFNFEEANMSGELWLAEGFTSYYGSLIMHRAGLAPRQQMITQLGRLADSVTRAPGRQFRSAVEMSQMAPFVDAARSVDRTNFSNTFISYYSYGDAIALELDLALRARSNGKTSLDDYMRALWVRHGKPGGPQPGLVSAPYTISDARAALAEVSGDVTFAADFFRRYIEGREVIDWAPLFARAGIVYKPAAPDRAWLGDVALRYDKGGSMSAPAPMGSPIYAAGIEQDDVLVSLDGEALTSASVLDQVLRRHKPGDAIPVVFQRRGKETNATITLAADPRFEAVPIENAGGTLGEAEKAFREAWLGSRVQPR